VYVQHVVVGKYIASVYGAHNPKVLSWCTSILILKQNALYCEIEANWKKGRKKIDKGKVAIVYVQHVVVGKYIASVYGAHNPKVLSWCTSILILKQKVLYCEIEANWKRREKNR